ncbi:MAG: Kdo hydroxylase family protein [Candidatus Binataceae bacterium]
MGLIEITGFTSHGSKDPAAGTERLRWYCERLEDGDILWLPQFPVISEQDRDFLTGVRQAGSSLVKNISYEPANQRLRGYARSATDALRLKRVLHGYSEMTRTAIEKLLPSYAGAMEIDFTSFRPLEEQGRPLRGRSRNDLIHVDAFPTRPARGRRILRFFTNVHRAKPRVWNTSQTFEDLAAHMALDAGLIRYAASAGGLAGGLRKALTAAARGAGIAIAERAPYDQFMLRFHDYLKANQDFQRECPKQRHEFPPGSSWIAFTDTVSHAVQSGQSALEQTFFVPVSSLIAPHKSPLRILESLAGRPIV